MTSARAYFGPGAGLVTIVTSSVEKTKCLLPARIVAS